MDRQWRKRWVTGALLAVLLGGITVLSGCPCPKQPPPEPTPTRSEGPPRDPSAKLVTINEGLGVDVPTVHLSRGKKEAVQWNNASDDTVMIVIEEGAVGIEIPPHEFSQVHRVYSKAAIGEHDYAIIGPAGKPPGTPQIDVGP